MKTPSIPRFDGLATFLALPAEHQRNIGSLALELAAAWHAQDDASRTIGFTIEERIALAAGMRAMNLLQEAFGNALPAERLRDEEGRVRIPISLGPICRGCGCSQFDPCPEGCGWAEDDLCTACQARGVS